MASIVLIVGLIALAAYLCIRGTCLGRILGAFMVIASVIFFLSFITECFI